MSTIQDEREYCYSCLARPRTILLQRCGGLEILSWKLACYVLRDELTWSCEENTIYKYGLVLGETGWAATGEGSVKRIVRRCAFESFGIININ